MKYLILTLLLHTPHILASGCNPGDVQLDFEKPIFNLGKFKASYECLYSQCHIYINRSENFEFHSLKLQKEYKTAPEIKDLGEIEIHIYHQYFISSCSEIHRYVLGIDFQGMRFREVEDLHEL